jgi:hypothetical protein
MDFGAVGKLQGPELSKRGPLRFLVRKFLAMPPPSSGKRCSIVVGDFTYRRAGNRSALQTSGFFGTSIALTSASLSTACSEA